LGGRSLACSTAKQCVACAIALSCCLASRAHSGGRSSRLSTSRTSTFGDLGVVVTIRHAKTYQEGVERDVGVPFVLKQSGALAGHGCPANGCGSRRSGKGGRFVPSPCRAAATTVST
jgi:hypothetical protein